MYPMACGIFLKWGSNLCLMHCQAVYPPLDHQGNPIILVWKFWVLVPRSFLISISFTSYTVLCLVTQSCPTLFNPGSSIHGILQARILEWVAIPFSRGLSQPRDETQVPRTAGRFFTVLIGDSVLFILSFCDFCLKKIDAFLDESGATQMLRQWRWGSRVWPGVRMVKQHGTLHPSGTRETP